MECEKSQKEKSVALGGESIRGRILEWGKATGAEKAEGFRTALSWVFVVSLALFPFGHSFREAGPILCGVLLACYYRYGYADSNLARFGGKWLFALFYVFVAGNVLWSIDMPHSWDYVRPNLWQGFLLPFIGMEVVRSVRDLRRVVVACCLAVFFQGLDGVWQFFAGVDLIKGDPIMSGRLTGSMSTYRVGNYMGIALLPACGFWALLAAPRSAWGRAGLTALVLAPALFLWVFAKTRSGWLAFSGGLFLLWVAVLGRFAWYKVLIPAAGAVALVLFGPQRASLETAMQDGRVEIWRIAWKIFESHPFIGAGASTFGPGRDALGLELVRNPHDIPHPHNIYLQFLSDGGVLGLLIGCAFLFGLAWWAWRTIRRGIWDGRQGQRVFWTLAAFVWAGYMGYLITGMTGHNFYRSWWLAQGMGLLGVTLGACVAGRRRDTA